VPADSAAIAPPGSELEVYLLTAGPGDAIWEKFSHNAIRIRNTRTGSDVAYNWGIFSFRQENFITRLIQGRMLYAMYGIPTDAMISSYRAADRVVVQHPVNLTAAEKWELERLVRAMDTDANRNYIYHYYLDNCSTRVRDALDAVLDGQIRERWGATETGTSFRWHTRRLLRSVAWAYYGIQYVLGNPGDRPISAHEEMFLPRLLAGYLEETEVTHADGTRTPLLGEASVVVDSDRPAPATDVPTTWWLSGLAGLAIGLVLWALGLAAVRGSAAGRWGLGLVGGLWAGLTGLLGTGLILSWFFTDHGFWRWNENAFLTNPLGLVAGLLLLGALVSRDWSGAARWTRWLALVGLAGLVLQLLPGLDQQNADLILLILPGHLALALAVQEMLYRQQS